MKSLSKLLCATLISAAVALGAACSSSPVNVTVVNPDASTAGKDAATPLKDASVSDTSPAVDANQPPCPGTESLCDSACVDTTRDTENCGSCGMACAVGEVCNSGACATSCQAELNLCGGDGGAAYCANFQSDNANCGACGTTCASGLSCVLGACTLVCPSGLSICAGADGGAAYCANTVTDSHNCGGCGVTCGAGTVCSMGTCTETCGTGLTTCSSPPSVDGGTDGGAVADGGDAGAFAPYCANIKADPFNCNGCGTACSFGANSQAACLNATCALVCANGFGNCDTSFTNGCETALTAASNCGACGNVCANGGACINQRCTSPAPTGVVALQKVLTGCTNPAPYGNETVAVDPAGNMYVAGICALGAVEVTSSVDGGTTWRTPVTVPGLTATGTFSITLATGGAGGALAVFLVTSGGTFEVSTSADAGATFSATPTSITTGIAANGISVNTSDATFATVTQSAGGAPKTYSNSSANLTGTWTNDPFNYFVSAGTGQFAFTHVITQLSSFVLLNSFGTSGYNGSISSAGSGGASGPVTFPAIVHPTSGYQAGIYFAGDGTVLYGPSFSSVGTLGTIVAGTRSLVGRATDLLVAGEATAGSSLVQAFNTSTKVFDTGATVVGSAPMVANIAGSNFALVSVTTSGNVSAAIVQP